MGRQLERHVTTVEVAPDSETFRLGPGDVKKSSISLGLQNAVQWRMVMSGGQDERSQMHAMSLLLNT